MVRASTNNVTVTSVSTVPNSISLPTCKISLSREENMRYGYKDGVLDKNVIITLEDASAMGINTKRLGKDANGNTIVHPLCFSDEQVVCTKEKKKKKAYIRVMQISEDSESRMTQVQAWPDNDDINLKF
ncbi:hypothetical protein Tco_0843934 [Tanacetum coccineum]